MRILYLHQFFMTRGGVGGTRSYEFARRFVAQGHDVTMVTARDASAEPADPLRRVIDGIEVVEIEAGYSDYPRGTAMAYPQRMLAFAQFAVASALAVIRLPRPDVILATSPPLTVAIPALLARRLRRAPLVFEVRDLWPEAPRQMGALRNPLVLAVARALERLAYREAAHVIALSPGMADGVVGAGKQREQVSMIPNAADLDLFSPAVDGSEWLERLGAEGRFVCSYFGTMGEANDLTVVVEAARELETRGEHGVLFVLHGRGKRRPVLEEMAAGLDNLRFSDPVGDKGEVARLAAASDACMTIYADVPVLYTCSPNKLFDTFAAGRPAIVNTPGWLRELVEENDAGVYARPGDAGALADAVLRLRDDPEGVARMGGNARRLAEERFARDDLAGQVLAVLRAAAGG